MQTVPQLRARARQIYPTVKANIDALGVFKSENGLVPAETHTELTTSFKALAEAFPLECEAVRAVSHKLLYRYYLAAILATESLTAESIQAPEEFDTEEDQEEMLELYGTDVFSQDEEEVEDFMPGLFFSYEPIDEEDEIDA